MPTSQPVWGEFTKLLLVSPRFTLSNQTGQPLQLMQADTDTKRVSRISHELRRLTVKNRGVQGRVVRNTRTAGRWARRMMHSI